MSWRSVLFEGESDLDRDLPVCDFAVLDVAAGVQDLEPSQLSYGLRRTGDGAFHGVIGTRRRRPHQLQRLVDVVGHRSPHFASAITPSSPACTCRSAHLYSVRSIFSISARLRF